MEVNERKREIGLEAVEAFRNSNFYGGALMATGSGKTWVMLKCLEEIISKIGIDTANILYTCNSTNLRDKDFPNEVKKWGYEEYLPYMERMCYQSAYKLKNSDYNILLADEGDFMLTNEYVKLLENNKFSYIIFVSATLTSDKAKMLEELDIPIVYKKAMHELEKESVLNKSNYFYVNFMLNERENKQYLEYNRVISDIMNRSENVYRDLESVLRQRKLFLNKLDSSAIVARELIPRIDGRTLVFSELTEQIDRIYPYTYHGGNVEDNNLELFNEGEIEALGVVGKIDRGVNLYQVQNIILESCSSSKTKIQQKLGRGKRLDVEDYLNVYMLIPYYMAKFPKNAVKPTIVLKWLETALKDFKILNIETFKF